MGDAALILIRQLSQFVRCHRLRQAKRHFLHSQAVYSHSTAGHAEEARRAATGPARVNLLGVGVLNWKRFSLVAFVSASALAAVLAWPWKRGNYESHISARQHIVFYHLSRMSDPVIVLGDSITEASTLPRSVCGHPVVNAGLNGASTASDLGGWLAPVVEGKRLAMIVVALGTNDVLSLASLGERNFADRYGRLLAELSKLAPRLAIMQIPPVEARSRITDKMRDETMATIDRYNSVLPDIAARNSATFVALPAVDGPYTIDGVHLSSEGYAAWDEAVMQAAAAVCG